MITDAARGPSDVRVAFVTAPDPESAEMLGRAVVEEGLAACVNILPGVTSVYRWQGEVRRDAEVVMMVKTTDAHASALARRVAELHPYEVPEVVVVEVVEGYAPYLEWVRVETTTGSEGRA